MLQERRKISQRITQKEEDLHVMRHILASQGPKKMNEYLENNQTKATVKVQMLWKAVMAK